MMDETLKLGVVQDHQDAVCPSRERDTDSCFDLYSCESAVIENGCTVVVNLGIKLSIPPGYEFIIKERSGLAAKGIIVGAGVVDEEYRGVVKVILRYLKPEQGADTDNFYKINVGQKVAQGQLRKRVNFELVQLSESEFNSNTDRGDRGFGSSGN